MTYGTRADCTRDNRKVVCPNANPFGYGRRNAKRGSWIQFEIDGHQNGGRVIGRVVCEGKTYIEIIRFDTLLASVWVYWVNPEDVRVVYADVPHATIEFLTGEWTEAHTILTRAHNGFVHENLLSAT